jgi:hypothetical protein
VSACAVFEFPRSKFLHLATRCWIRTYRRTYGRVGDGYLKSYVLSEPEVMVTERTDDDECLILVVGVATGCLLVGSGASSSG